MLLYIILFLMASLGAFLDLSNIKKEHKNIFLCILGSICILLSGIRWETGTDWAQYLNFFKNNDTFEEFNGDVFEIGYTFLNYLIKSISSQYSLLLLSMSAIIVFLKYKCISLYAIFPLTSILLNFSNYTGDLFPVRQNIALAITFFSTIFIIRKNFLSFFLSLF